MKLEFFSVLYQSETTVQLQMKRLTKPKSPSLDGNKCRLAALLKQAHQSEREYLKLAQHLAIPKIKQLQLPK